VGVTFVCARPRARGSDDITCTTYMLWVIGAIAFTNACGVD
jgi:hypothetical protein